MKKLSVILLCLLLALLLCGCVPDLQRIRGQEVIRECSSPSGRYTIIAYLNNGGATVNYAVLCTVKDNETGSSRNIYWNYHCSDAAIEWIDDQTAVINGITLNVLKNTWDYRKQQ